MIHIIRENGYFIHVWDEKHTCCILKFKDMMTLFLMQVGNVWWAFEIRRIVMLPTYQMFEFCIFIDKAISFASTII